MHQPYLPAILISRGDSPVQRSEAVRCAAMGLNLLTTAFFAGFLAYTVVARSHLEGLARQFVTEKTLHYAEPMVALTEASLESKLGQAWLSESQSTAMRREIDEYHQNPAGYVADLTRQARIARDQEPPSPLAAKVASIKERIRTFYDDTLAALVADLRIFAASNLVAASLALSLAWMSRGSVRRSVVWFSLLLFVAVLYCSSMYVEDLTFFRILFRLHIGWGYPVVLAAVLVALFLEYGHLSRAASSAADGVRVLPTE
jgi:hypothetical protein